MDNKSKNIATIISVVLLILSVIGRWPYGFYTLLRIIVFGTTVYLSWLAYRNEKQSWAWVFGFIALIFNPLIPLYLDRDLWKAIDLIVAVFLMVSSFVFKVNQIWENKL